MKKYVCSRLITFIFLTTISNILFAQNTVYVDLTTSTPAGTDNTSCGAINAPCATITYALGRATTIYGANSVTIKIKSAGTYVAPDTIKRSNSIISGLLTGIPSNAEGSRDATNAESRFICNTTSYITIANNVNNITIEGFEFRSNTNSATVPMITFAANGVNSDIIIRRNSVVGNSGYSGVTNGRVQPFLIKPASGTLTNLQITENRFFGYVAASLTTVITINTAESGAIRSNVFGAEAKYANNPNPPTNITSNYLDKAIVIGGVKNFAIAQNQFQGMNLSAIELLSTSNVSTANNDAIVRIDSNTFDRVNQQTVAAPTTTPTEPATIAAGILLRADSFTGDSVLIRFNEFLGNNKIGIAIPNANNGFTTNSIKIFSNKFAESNAHADIYVGSDATLAVPISTQGKIDVNANWWGKTTAPYTPTTATTAGITSDIFGSTTATTFTKPVVWLTSAADAANPGLAFIPTNKVVRSNGVDAELSQVFAAVPENWELELADGSYSTIPTIVRSFSLNPLDATADGESFPGLILNGSNYDGSAPILTLSKNIQIANGNNVTLTKGKIQLGTHNMRIWGSSGLPDGNKDSYIITNSTGKLLQIGIGSDKTGEVIFPIGPDNLSYTPARITNTGTSDNFSVIVKPGISPVGNDGNLVTDNAVDLTWDVEEGVIGGSNVTLTLQWNAGDPVATPSEPNNEWPGFDNTTCYMAHYTGGKWVNQEMPLGSAAQAGTVTDYPSWKKTASGITSFSPFAIGSPGAALPVTLVDFKAALKNNDVELSWITASEKDNAHFSVERSEDGSTFREIGKIQGKGTTDISNNYNFTDVFATETGRDILYYRLKQVDTDGKFSYSKIQDVVLQTWALRLFPNPADRIVNIALPGRAHLQVISSQGQVVMEKEFESLTQLNVSSLAKGMYIFKLTNGKDISFRKVNIF